MSIEVKGLLSGLAAALGVLGVAFGLSPLLQPQMAGKAKRDPPANTGALTTMSVLGQEAKRGFALFDRNCAHCHADDARGDEGPNLHGLVQSDARITTIILGGAKGEMPAFAKKFNDADVQALVAYLRTLND